MILSWSWLEGTADGSKKETQSRLHSKLRDGEQVGPAPEDPEYHRVRKARRSDGELARGYPSWPGIMNAD